MPAPAMSYEEARFLVTDRVGSARMPPAVEMVPLAAAAGRVLAGPITADRDYPPLNRSVRDGFAVRSASLPGELRVAGEVRAGEAFAGILQPGDAIEIMTGAPVPRGADAVVMVEHTERRGGRVFIPAPADPGQFISAQGEEARAGEMLLRPGVRLGYTEVALLAATGHAEVPVYRKPRIAILPTGDELVAVDSTPSSHQVRNSNAYALAAQVARAGAVPYMLPPARDNEADTLAAIEQGLACDLLLLSGGVSAGKYDLVERALASFDAEFFFDRVAIQPGQPLVFGRARNRFFFGLPGNPASTMITFEVFARAAVELLAGQTMSSVPLTLGRLTEDFRHKPGLTRFLPALLRGCGDLTPLESKGSADIPALTRANVFLVADALRAEWRAGETINVLWK